MNTNNEQQHSVHFCHVCYIQKVSEDSIVPVVRDLVIGEADKWICARCWTDRTLNNPDVAFVISVIGSFIPEEEVGKRNFHHTLTEWSQAVLSLRSMKSMKSFFRGYAYWRIGPQVPPVQAEREARDNIGCPLNDAGWWLRFKWWLACGIVRCDNFHM